MLNFPVLIQLFSILTFACAYYNGPFILWGRKELNDIDVNSLNDLNEKLLRDIYSESPAIILFVRNASSRLNEENFPIFKDLIEKTKHIYLTQHQLSSDPVDYNLNAEVCQYIKNISFDLSSMKFEYF